MKIHTSKGYKFVFVEKVSNHMKFGCSCKIIRIPQYIYIKKKRHDHLKHLHFGGPVFSFNLMQHRSYIPFTQLTVHNRIQRHVSLFLCHRDHLSNIVKREYWTCDLMLQICTLESWIKERLPVIVLY